MSTVPPVRLVLDEMFTPVIARQLRDRGWDVVAVADDPQLRAMSDPELRAWADEHGRRIVSENARDFRPLIVEDPTGPGVLFTTSRTFPRTQRGIGKLTAAIDAWMTTTTKTEQLTEVWLEPAPKHRRN